MASSGSWRHRRRWRRWPLFDHVAQHMAVGGLTPGCVPRVAEVVQLRSKARGQCRRVPVAVVGLLGPAHRRHVPCVTLAAACRKCCYAEGRKRVRGTRGGAPHSSPPPSRGARIRSLCRRGNFPPRSCYSCSPLDLPAECGCHRSIQSWRGQREGQWRLVVVVLLHTTHTRGSRRSTCSQRAPRSASQARATF